MSEPVLAAALGAMAADVVKLGKEKKRNRQFRPLPQDVIQRKEGKKTSIYESNDERGSRTAAYGNGFRGLQRRAEDLKKHNAAEDAKTEKFIKSIVRIQQK